MADKFIVTPKGSEIKEEKSITVSLRMPKTLRDKYIELAEQSGHTRSDLMNRALLFALEHLEFIPDEK